MDSDAGDRLRGDARLELRVFEHHLGAEPHFLGRLPDKDDGARPAIAKPGERARRPDPDREMRVVAAGVHRPVRARVRQARLFPDRQRVHVNPGEHRRALAVLEDRDHAEAADLLGHRPSGAPHLGRKPGRRLLFLERNFRIRVKPLIKLEERTRFERDRLGDRAVQVVARRRGQRGRHVRFRRRASGENESRGEKRGSAHGVTSTMRSKSSP